MYKCDSRCYSYNNGHICKHIHCIHAFYRKQQQEQTQSLEDPEDVQYSSSDMTEECGNVVYAESVSDPLRGNFYRYNYSALTLKTV